MINCTLNNSNNPGTVNNNNIPNPICGIIVKINFKIESFQTFNIVITLFENNKPDYKVTITDGWSKTINFPQNENFINKKNVSSMRIEVVLKEKKTNIPPFEVKIELDFIKEI